MNNNNHTNNNNSRRWSSRSARSAPNKKEEGQTTIRNMLIQLVTQQTKLIKQLNITHRPYNTPKHDRRKLTRVS